eukprot:SAG11_NODE_15233_length_584_cov_1.331959_1_plen_46_part_10
MLRFTGTGYVADMERIRSYAVSISTLPSVNASILPTSMSSSRAMMP